MLHVSGDSFDGIQSGFLRTPISDALAPNPVSDSSGLDDIRTSLLSSSALTADAGGARTNLVQNDMGILPISDPAHVSHVIAVDQADSFHFPQSQISNGIVRLPPTADVATQQDEINFIAGVDQNNQVVATSFETWKILPTPTNPAVYNATSGTTKWGAGAAGTAGGTVTFAFEVASAWTADEQAAFIAGYALWSNLANITYQFSNDPATANIVIKRGGVNGNPTGAFFSGAGSGSGSPGTVGSTNVFHFNATGAFINIQTGVSSFGPITTDPGVQGGNAWGTIVHEEGHSLGLGHAGPYNGNVDVTTQQFGPQDNTLWSIMSYIDPKTATATYYNQNPAGIATSWGTSPDVRNAGFFFDRGPNTPMMLDILAAQQLYGAPTATVLNGGQIYGFHSNIDASIKPFFDFNVNKDPIVTLWNAGTGDVFSAQSNTLDLSGWATPSTVNLNPGTFSSADGLVNNIGIAFGTRIDRFVGGSGVDTVTANNNGDIISGGTGGSDVFTGGTGNDGFYFGTAYDVGDRANGGGGTNNQVALEGDYSGGITISGTQFQNVQVLALLPGFNYNITLTNDLTAAASTFTVWAVKLGGANAVNVDASGELDANLVFYMGAGNDTVKGGALADTIWGEGGKDTLTGGLGADTFAYRGATDSSSTNFDVIMDFNAAAGDKFKLGIAVTSVNVVVGAQALATASFDADVAAAVNASLDATHPALFVAGAGNYTGHTFLVVEAGGGVGYQANSDYVFDLIGGGAGLASANFI